MSKVLEIYNEMEKHLSSNPDKLNKINTDISLMVSQIYTHAMQSDEGMCYKFILPIAGVHKLFDIVELDPITVEHAFRQDWTYPAGTNMYGDKYYHILLLIMYYAMKTKNNLLLNNAYLLFLVKIWNGRKAELLRYCDKRIMNYVVSHMITNKHKTAEFDSPLRLLKDYYVPSMLKKYRPVVENNIDELKKILMQSWTRVRQIFVSRPSIDMDTGEKRAQGGLMVLYMKAKQGGLYLSTPTIMKDDEDGGSNFEQYSTINNRDEIITNTADNITMNSMIKYPVEFIQAVNSQTKVSSKIIEKIFGSLHKHKYYDLIHDIIAIILSRTNVVDKSDICRPEFTTSIKKNIISSKNTEDMRKLQKLLKLLIASIFKDDLNLDFNSYSNVQQIQITNVIVYGLVYNLRRVNCQGQ